MSGAYSLPAKIKNIAKINTALMTTLKEEIELASDWCDRLCDSSTVDRKWREVAAEGLFSLALKRSWPLSQVWSQQVGHHDPSNH